MDVSKIFFSLKFISKETLFAPKFDSRPVDGLLNECIRHYFFPLEPKKLKKIITPGLRLTQVTGFHTT